MGRPFGYFARRRARESAIRPGLGMTDPAEPPPFEPSTLFDRPTPQSAPPSPQPVDPPDLGELAKLIRSALEQGNVTVAADGEVLDLRPAGLRGSAFEPLQLPEAEPPSTPS